MDRVEVLTELLKAAGATPAQMQVYTIAIAFENIEDRCSINIADPVINLIYHIVALADNLNEVRRSLNISRKRIEKAMDATC
jgi:hypothetical protein